MLRNIFAPPVHQIGPVPASGLFEYFAEIVLDSIRLQSVKRGYLRVLHSRRNAYHNSALAVSEFHTKIVSRRT